MTNFPILSDPIQTLQSWAALLYRIEVPVNIRAFEWEGEIEAGAEAIIAHKLKLVPTRFEVLDTRVGGILVRGARRWTEDLIFIKNRASTTTFVGKILVMP